jgi:hypothetical protein
MEWQSNGVEKWWSAMEWVFLSLHRSTFLDPQSRFPLLLSSGNVGAWRSIHSELF